MKSIMNLKEASTWATQFLGKNVTTTNISYLIQYGKIEKIGKSRETLINIEELEHYYTKFHINTRHLPKNKTDENLNWKLSFSEYKEAETTKHVHRLHPYKGKFIPQLVEYFLDTHTDEYKKEVYFKSGDIILDPFCGSGTTLVQANELSIHSIGIDVSVFNSLISNVKLNNYNISDILEISSNITEKLNEFRREHSNLFFEIKLTEILKQYNSEYFPTPEYRKKVIQGLINEKEYSNQKEKEINIQFNSLKKIHNIAPLQNGNNFLTKWFFPCVLEEIYFVQSLIDKIENPINKNLFQLILSRTIRSCRATTHADLGTLIKPVETIYYCKKHRKLCRPVFSILNWWKRYSQDTISRIHQYSAIKTNALHQCLIGDSKSLDILKILSVQNKELYKKIEKNKISGIFTSPPYVGLIDYHEQHAYAFDLFHFERNDNLEIGTLQEGQGKSAQEKYIENISAVLKNCKKYLQKNFNIFLVANDKYNLYPQIAQNSNLIIVKEFKRPVLNRVEKDRGAYSESIFHLREK